MNVTKDGSVRVVARAIAKVDQIVEVKAILNTLMQCTRREQGCLRYEVWQNREEPTDFTTIEEWVDQVSLDAHFQAPHFKTAIAELRDRLEAEADIRFYKLLS